MKKDCQKFAEWKKKKGYTSHEKEEHAGIVLNTIAHKEVSRGSMKSGNYTNLSRTSKLSFETDECETDSETEHQVLG